MTIVNSINCLIVNLKRMKVTLVDDVKVNVAGECMVTCSFWLLKRNGKLYNAIIPNAKTNTLIPIFEK